MMRSGWLDLLLLIVGTGVGFSLVRRLPLDLRPPPSPVPPSSPPLHVRDVPEGPRRCEVLEEMRQQRLAAIEREERALQGDLSALREEGVAAGALPWPWPESPEPHTTPQAVEAALRRSQEKTGWEGWHATVDCSEYPCLLIYDADYDDLGVPPFAGFEGGFGVSNGVRRMILYPLSKAGFPAELKLRLDVRTSKLIEESL